MKRTMILIAVALVAMVAIGGCTPAITPTPQKVTISDSFVQIDTSGTVLSGIYQFDGEGTYYAADGTALTVQSKGSDIFTATKSGVNYFNEKFVNSTRPATENAGLAITITSGGSGKYSFFVEASTVKVAMWTSSWHDETTFGTYQDAGFIVNSTYSVTGTKL